MRPSQHHLEIRKNKDLNLSKIKKLKKVIMLMMIPVLLTSCNKSKPTGPIVCDFGFTSLTKEKLENKTWKKSCFEDEDQGGNLSYFDESYSFLGDHFVFSSIKYSNPDCSPGSEISSKEMSGSYRVEEYNKILLDYDSFFLGFHDEFLVEENNQLGFCGLNDWQVNIFQDVEGLRCGEEGVDSVSYSDSTVALRTQILKDTSDLEIEGVWYKLHIEVQEEE
jgi:hypothetical protein